MRSGLGVGIRIVRNQGTAVRRKFTSTRQAKEVESSALATKWDDIAEEPFYMRDWTDDGIPFVHEGETYWSGWWFKTVAERDRFVAWRDNHGCQLREPAR